MRRLAAVMTFTTILVACRAALPAGSPAEPAEPAVHGGFTLETIAHVEGARELAVAPNGDLFAGTSGNEIVVIPNAQGRAGEPRVYASFDDRPVAGIALAGGTLYAGAQHGVYAMPYVAGKYRAGKAPVKIAALRPSDSGGHVTTTVAVSGDALYASVGSSCNNCQPEADPTRATIQEMHSDGSGMHAKAEHIRNAIALAVDPASGHLWAASAGQDELAHGHPYEIFDDVGAHAGPVDYGWPYCYENRTAVGDHSCATAAVPRVVFPAYETPVGAVFYPLAPRGAHAFPQAYRGGAFVALHGSWHTPPVPPRVVFVSLHGDAPLTPVDWNDPATQWHEFVGGFQKPNGARIARPTGIAVGPDGSLFVAEDSGGSIYRIRPKQ